MMSVDRSGEADTATVYTEPGPDGYAKQGTWQRGDEMSATAVPDLVVAVDDVFGS